MKLTPTQNKLIESLKDGKHIEYFRGIGTRWPPSANIANSEGHHLSTVSVATVRKLRHLGMLEEYNRQDYHSSFKLKPTDSVSIDLLKANY